MNKMMMKLERDGSESGRNVRPHVAGGATLSKAGSGTAWGREKQRSAAIRVIKARNAKRRAAYNASRG